MVNYINGAILEGIEKGQVLKGKIPRAKDLGLYFSPLATSATSEIDYIIGDLTHLLTDSAYSGVRMLRQKFHKFKQLSGRLSEIENVVIAAINRKTPDDEFVNKLVIGICNEINYPLQPPVASCLSQKYYHIYPYYNLICIPLLESEFLLHIPDIYHELGHPLISNDNPKTLEFQRQLGLFNIEAKKYFNQEIKRRELNKLAGNDSYNPLHVWRDSWVEKWSSELFCDLFATFTLGPAYAWSNIHMCAKMSWEIFRISMYQKTAHPADDARMKAILFGLRKLGYTTDAEQIESKWKEFKGIINQKPSPEYLIALPESLLEQACEYCYKGTLAIDCSLASQSNNSQFFKLLNSSWVTFWLNPNEFGHWEKIRVKTLKESL